MEGSNKKGRRNFLIQSSLASSALFIPGQAIANNLFSEKTVVENELNISLFSKHLQFLNYKNMAEAAKEMGFDSLDLTVRPKGHVLPENVEKDLPLATEAMKAVGLKPMMISTNVMDAQNEVQRQVLKTASELGYKFYRPAWEKYPDDRDVLKTVDKMRSQFSELVNLNIEYNINASYQNHSGQYFGAPIWDLYDVLKDLPKEEFGSQYDIVHATIEAGKSWEVNFKLISPYINTLVVKDFIWGEVNGKWDRINVPMGEGMVDFKRYFHLLKKYKINVPISIHVEHDLGGAENGGDPTIPQEEVFKRIKADLDFVRNTWSEVK